MNENTGPEGMTEEKLAALLGAVGPRARPPVAAIAEVRAAVEAQWRATVAARQRQRQFTTWAAAAGIAAAAVALWVVGMPQAPSQESVASLARVVGEVQQDDGDGRWAPLAAAGSVRAGSRLRTGADGRAALKLDGGVEVRLDSGTLVAFEDAQHATLSQGAVYVDAGADPRASSPDFALETPAGVVRHLGTQYEARLRGRELRLGIREGRVQVDGPAGDLQASAGEQLVVSGDHVARSRLAPTAADWAWLATITPPFSLDGRSVDAFLAWAGRETGRAVEYASPDAAAQARSVILRGNVEGLTPDAAVIAVLSTTSLRPVVGSERIRIETAVR